ncbi:unnamed protein product [Prorocentrum cordatum]|uniref:Uncharacterized protein n=1 Tax=Prorocentrum cordatum TaxID=2364126 RepID=A0ABN9U5E1_9DINO|nr:unnamed protein product [Polarella glacialis]
MLKASLEEHGSLLVQSLPTHIRQAGIVIKGHNLATAIQSSSPAKSTRPPSSTTLVPKAFCEMTPTPTRRSSFGAAAMPRPPFATRTSSSVRSGSWLMHAFGRLVSGTTPRTSSESTGSRASSSARSTTWSTSSSPLLSRTSASSRRHRHLPDLGRPGQLYDHSCALVLNECLADQV